LSLKDQKHLDLKLFSIGSVISCVQIARAQKTTGGKNVIEFEQSQDFRKREGQSENLVLPLVGKAIHNGNWDKHRTIKNNRMTHLKIVILFTSNIDNGKILFLFVVKISQKHFQAPAFLSCINQRLFSKSKSRNKISQR